MSAAIQVPVFWQIRHRVWQTAKPPQRAQTQSESPRQQVKASLAFYRKHTETLLRRYLHVSMLVGRTPSILHEEEPRGWASHRARHTFEDSVIFVLDMEACLKKLSWLERELLSKIVLQEYSYGEAALALRVSTRRVTARFGEALDHLTRVLLDSGTAVVPQ